MHLVLSALLLCSLVVLLLAGLASVLRDLLSRDFRALPSPSREPRVLNLDLPRDLDHPVGR